MQRNPKEYLDLVKDTTLGDKYILDVSRYDILANPNYAN